MHSSSATADPARAQHQFRVGFLGLCIFFLVSFTSPFWLMDYAYHDQYRYFSNQQKTCIDDSEFVWIARFGRPLASLIECGTFLSVKRMGHLRIVRMICVAASAILFVLLFLMFEPFLGTLAAGFLSLCLLSLPGYHFAFFIGNLANVLGMIFGALGGYLAYLRVRSLTKTSLRQLARASLLPGFFLILGDLLYSAQASIFLIPFLLELLFGKDSWPDRRRRVLFGVATFFAASLVYFLIVKLFFFEPSAEYGARRFELFGNFPKKITQLIGITVFAYKMWNIDLAAKLLSFWSVALVGSMLIGAIALARTAKKPLLGLEFCAWFLIVFLCLNVTNVAGVGGMVLFRTTLIYQMGIVLCSVMLLYTAGKMLPKFGLYLLPAITFGFLVYGGTLAMDYTLANVRNSNWEMEYITSKVCRAKKPFTHVHFVTFIDGRDLIRRKSLTDEFSIHSTASRLWTLNLLRVALIECGIENPQVKHCYPEDTQCLSTAPSGHYTTSAGTRNTPYTPKENWLVVNMEKARWYLWQ